MLENVISISYKLDYMCSKLWLKKLTSTLPAKIEAENPRRCQSAVEAGDRNRTISSDPLVLIDSFGRSQPQNLYKYIHFSYFILFIRQNYNNTCF